jgi:hypothetical protein
MMTRTGTVVRASRVAASAIQSSRAKGRLAGVSSARRRSLTPSGRAGSGSMDSPVRNRAMDAS